MSAASLVVSLVWRQARISVVAFLAVTLTLVLLAADRMHNLTCAPNFGNACWHAVQTHVTEV